MSLQAHSLEELPVSIASGPSSPQANRPEYFCSVNSMRIDEDDSDDEELIQYSNLEIFISSIKIHNFFLSLFYLLTICHFRWNLSVIFIFICIWLEDIFIIALIGRHQDNFKALNCSIFLESALLIFIKTCVLLFFNFSYFPITYVAAFVLLIYLIILTVEVVKKFQRLNRSSLPIAINVFKLFLCIQFLMVCLKWSHHVSWTWNSILLILWIFLILFSLIHFFTIWALIEAFFLQYQKKERYQYTLGCLWVFLNLFPYSLLGFLFLKAFIVQLDSSVFTFHFQLELIASYIVVLFFYSFFFSKHAVFFCKRIIGIEPSKQTPGTREKSSSLLVQIPKFVIQVSSTFFSFPKSNRYRPPRHANDAKTKEQKKQHVVSPTYQNHQNMMSPKNEIKVKQRKSVEIEQFCLICFTNKPNIVLYPCKHGGLCKGCCRDLLQKNKSCYLCRKDIEQVLEVEPTDEDNSKHNVICSLEVNRYLQNPV